MRKSKIITKRPPKHSLAERAHLKRIKQKEGPSAQRRKLARAGLQPKKPIEP